VPDFLGLDGRLGPAVTALVGERGRWLAGLDPAWTGYLPPRPRDPSHRPVDTADWQSGAWEPRAAYLAALRRVDPAAGRVLVETGWPTESADDRAELLAALEEGLDVGDVPFLETALRDRRAAVSAPAARLLDLLCARQPLGAQPDVGRRMVNRARPLVRLTRHGVLRSPTLEVVAPESLDDDARQDGITDTAVGPLGQRAGWLQEILRRTPLSLWENEFRRSPAEVLGLPVAGDFARELHQAWRAATVGQRNRAWARAFLSRPDTPVDGSLSRLLPVAEHTAYVRDALESVDTGDPTVLPLLSTVEGPWPADLGRAVVAYLESLVETRLVRESAALLRLAARRLPVRQPIPVETIGARITAEDWADHRSRAVAFDHPWRAALGALSATLSLRARVDDELRRSPP
jgi:hypothetical protein